MNEFRLMRLLVAIGVAASLAGVAPEVEFVQRLEEHGLSKLADEFAAAQIELPTLAPRTRAELAAAWIRIVAQRNLNRLPDVKPGGDAMAWDAMAKCAAHYRSAAERFAPQGDSLAILVELQLALAQVSQAQQLGAGEAWSAEGDFAPMQAALRLAIAKLEKVAKIAAEQLARHAGEPTSRGDQKERLLRGELETLALRLPLQIGTLRRWQASSYPVRSPDRVNALNLAMECLDHPARLVGNTEISTSARFEQIACLRLGGHFDEAQSEIDRFRRVDPTASWPVSLANEQILLWIDRNEPDAAWALAQQLLTLSDEAHAAELDLTLLKVLLDERRRAKRADNEAKREQCTRQAIDLTRRIAERHGVFFHRNAETLLGRALADETQTDDPGLLMRAAASLLVAGKVTEGISALDRAAELRRAERDVQGAFDSAYEAGLACRNAGDLAAASVRFERLALEWPNEPRAPEVHWLAVGAAAQTSQDDHALAQQPAPSSGAIVEFERLLSQQLELWPRALQADTAHWWRGRLRHGRNQLSMAVDDLVQVPLTHRDYPSAVRILADCYRKQCRALTGEGAGAAARTAVVADAVGRLQSVITGPENQWPTDWTDLQRDVAIALAEIQIRVGSEGASYAATLVEAARRGSRGAESADGSASTSWQGKAMLWQATALARLGRRGDAMALLSQVGAIEATDAAVALEALSWQSDVGHRSAETEETAQFTLAVVEAVDASQRLSGAPYSIELSTRRAWALRALGRQAESLQMWRTLAADEPENGEAQLRLVEALAASPQDVDRREALTVLVHLERRAAPGGPLWRRARQQRIELQCALGELEQAQKLYRLTRTLYPHVEITFHPAKPSGDSR